MMEYEAFEGLRRSHFTTRSITVIIYTGRTSKLRPRNFQPEEERLDAFPIRQIDPGVAGMATSSLTKGGEITTN
jgi:hypothetical protein